MECRDRSGDPGTRANRDELQAEAAPAVNTSAAFRQFTGRAGRHQRRSATSSRRSRSSVRSERGRGGPGPDRLRLPIDAAAGGADQTVERLVGDGRRRQLAPIRAGYPHQTPEAVVVPRQPERRADQSRARLKVNAHPSATPGGTAEVAGKGGRHSRSIPPARVAVARGAATDGQVRAPRGQTPGPQSARPRDPTDPTHANRSG